MSASLAEQLPPPPRGSGLAHARASVSGSATTAPARPRRVSGRSLVRTLLKQPDHALHFQDINIVPIGARPVLEAIAELVAKAGPDLVYAPDLSFVVGGVPRLVALKMQAVGAEAEIEGHLAALARARLIIADAGSVRLALPPPATDTEDVSMVATMARSPGRRPKGMTDEAWAEYAEHHRRARALQLEHIQHAEALRARYVENPAGTAASPVQTSMMMVIPGGPRIPAFDISENISADISNADINRETETASADIPTGYSVSCAAAAASSTEIYNLDSKAVAEAACAPASDIGVNISDPISQIISAGRDVDISALASGLAETMNAGLCLPRDQHQLMGGVMQSCLTEGYSENELDDWITRVHTREKTNLVDRPGKAGIRGVRYCLKMLLDAIPAAKRGVPRVVASNPAEPKWDPDPRIAHDPALANAPEEFRGYIKPILDARDIQDPGRRRLRLQLSRTANPAAFAFMARRLPELLRIVDGEEEDQDIAAAAAG